MSDRSTIQKLRWRLQTVIAAHERRPRPDVQVALFPGEAGRPLRQVSAKLGQGYGTDRRRRVTIGQIPAPLHDTSGIVDRIEPVRDSGILSR